jgi:hypothetical protein
MRIKSFCVPTGKAGILEQDIREIHQMSVLMQENENRMKIPSPTARRVSIRRFQERKVEESADFPESNAQKPWRPEPRRCHRQRKFL